MALAPYLAECADEFVKSAVIESKVVRQGGRGLILRCAGDLVLRHEHRHASLGRDEARHYAATVRMRSEFYDVLRMQDEVVIATVGEELLLSHPQSEIWLNRETVAALVDSYGSGTNRETNDSVGSIPEWLKVSIGGERMLLSDQRTGRWVLLGSDHIEEFERRLRFLNRGLAEPSTLPPTIQLKGIAVHLQSAFTLSATLIDFVSRGQIRPFDELTPIYSLSASATTEGLELRDSDKRVALTPREASKWADIIQTELKHLNARQVERGGIRTVFASNENGRWILQWGDEVFLPDHRPERLHQCSLPGDTNVTIAKRAGEFLLLINAATGSCVALTDSESVDLEY